MEQKVFQRALTAMDSLLRVRWSDTTNVWVVDRVSYISPDEIYYLRRRAARLQNWVSFPKPDHSEKQRANNLSTWKDVHERLVSAEDGRRVVYYPNRLDQAAFDLLCAGDSQRYGGYSSFFDKIEEEERKEEALLEHRLSHRREEAAHEVFDYCDFVYRKRQAVVQTGHTDLGMLVHGKPTDSSLIHTGV